MTRRMMAGLDRMIALWLDGMMASVKVIPRSSIPGHTRSYLRRGHIIGSKSHILIYSQNQYEIYLVFHMFMRFNEFTLTFISYPNEFFGYRWFIGMNRL